MTDSSRDAGIDLIKAVAIVLVVIWHFQPVTESMLPAGSMPLSARNILKFFYLNLSLLAVPSFILVSLYLFIRKMSAEKTYWRKRLMRLVQVFLFWVCIQYILYLLLGGKLPLPLGKIVPGGGPDLPFGPSIFYYLFILILCTFWSLLFLKVPEKWKGILSAVIVVLSGLHFLLSPLFGMSLDTRAMENYYIYIPAAYWLYKSRDRFLRYRPLCIIAWLVSIVIEWSFTGMTSAYGRLSIFLGTLSFVSVFATGQETLSPPVRFLARYSLGIFALHIYFQNLCKYLLAVFLHQGGRPAAGLWMENLSVFAAAVFLTLLSVWLLGKTRWRVYVS